MIIKNYQKGGKRLGARHFDNSTPPPPHLKQKVQHAIAKYVLGCPSGPFIC